jgi:hypothetical protein
MQLFSVMNSVEYDVRHIGDDLKINNQYTSNIFASSVDENCMLKTKKPFNNLISKKLKLQQGSHRA